MKRLVASRYQRYFYLRWELGYAANTNVTFEIDGPLDIEALSKTIESLSNNHEFLRTTFSKEGDVLYQNIHHASGIQLELHDVSDQIRQGQNSDIDAWVKGLYHCQFNLDILPLVRFHLIKKGPEEYLLALVLHHAIADAVVAQFLVQYISQTYNNIAHNIESDPLVIPVMEDYLSDELEQYSERQHEQDLSYWKQHLANKTTHVDFPSENGFSARQAKVRDVSTYFELDRDLSASLLTFSRNQRVTPFVVISSVFALWLSRYVGQNEFVIVFPINMRPKEYKMLLGSFINSSFIDFNLHQDMSVAQLLTEVMQQRVIGRNHQNVPFVDVLECMLQQQGGSMSSAFNVSIYPSTQLGGAALSLEKCYVKGIPVNVNYSGDLSLAYQQGDVFEFRIDDVCGVFEGRGIDDAIAHFITVVREFVEHPESLLCEISSIPNNFLPAPVSKVSKSVLSLLTQFEYWAAHKADAVALIYNQENLSYRLLNAKANQLARLLLDNHLEATGKQMSSEALVGICVERSLNLAVSVIAAIKAGVAYVPLDPFYPKKRLLYMIEDSTPWCIITESKVVAAGSLQGVSVPVEIIDLNDQVIQKSIQNKEESNLGIDICPNNVMYVIYTSGSTGRPKAVVIRHGGVTNVLQYFAGLFDFRDTDRMLSVASLNFDIFVLEYGLPWLSGGCCILCSDEDKIDMERVQALCVQHRPTYIQATPTWWQSAIDFIPDNGLSLTILAGGEALSYQLKERLVERAASVWNLYGPTEATIWVSAFACLPGDPVLIGSPIDNVQLYVMDSQMQLCPIGVSGELYIGGVGLAAGYLHQKALTEASFVSNPLAQKLGFAGSDLLYATGDRVRWLSSCELEYLGRFDMQIKLHGYRIELGEIEHVLMSYVGILQAVAIVVGQEAERQLTAFITLEPDSSSFSLTECQEYLQESLPSHMLPMEIQVHSTLPLTPNGKINRMALAAANKSEQQKLLQLPVTPLERQWALLWSDVLRCGAISVHDNFFSLGGNSIKLIQLVGLAREYQLDLLPHHLLEHPTIAELVEFKEDLRADNLGAKSVVQQAMDAIDAPIIAVHADGDRQPIFMLHSGAGGALSSCRRLMAAFNPGQPSYIVDSYNLYHLDQPITTIAALASHYLKAIKIIQPEGPYDLLGWSLGGLIGFEIARQMLQQGDSVSNLVLIDSVYLNEKQRRILHHLSDMDLIQKGLYSLANITDPVSLNLLRRLYKIEYQMTQVYDAPILDQVRALLLRAGKVLQTDNDDINESMEVYYRITSSPKNGWGDALKNLTVENVDADHLSLMQQPCLTEVVQLIASYINKSDD